MWLSVYSNTVAAGVVLPSLLITTAPSETILSDPMGRYPL